MRLRNTASLVTLNPKLMLCSLLQGHFVSAHQKENQKQLCYPKPRHPKSSLCSNFYIYRQIIPKMSHYYPWKVGTTYFFFFFLMSICVISHLHLLANYWGFLMAQMVKNLPAMWEMWVWSLGLEDLLEEGMATHSSILAWRIPWTAEPEQLTLLPTILNLTQL